MKDGVPNGDRVGIEFGSNAEAITHCKAMAKDFRDNSLRDDQELEILVFQRDRQRNLSPVCSSGTDVTPPPLAFVHFLGPTVAVEPRWRRKRHDTGKR
jgi:hypothetical protein